MDFIFIISVLASVCSTLASLPQLITSKNALSKITMLLRFVGAILWSLYGFFKYEFVLMTCSGVVAFIEVILYLKMFFYQSEPDDT
jgi:uncharacterized protein with PQ loop repeat